MTVYVDDMYRYPMGRYGRMKMSHMAADSDEELLAMVDRIGLARKYIQHGHFDVSMSLRTRAIEAGAKQITMREMVRVRHGAT